MFSIKSGLVDAVRYFSDPMICLETVAKAKWADGPECPKCGGKKVSFIRSRMLWTCLKCRKQFSVKVGTIFEDSAVPLDKWLVAMWLLANCKNGISSYELAKDIKVTQRTAWFMLQRLRHAMHTGSINKMTGEIEADETYIGGLARNMHIDKRREKIGPGGIGKVAVMGLLKRHGEVRLQVLPNVQHPTLEPIIRKHVEVGSEVFTDALAGYRGLDDTAEYVHRVIDHAEAYARGNVHTNGIENFWSLLKRCLKGTYVSVEPFHLFRYLDEQAFRYNNRKDEDENLKTDAQRFAQVLGSVAGKRLTWNLLTCQEAG